jgi:hypothetical protein
LKCGALSLLAFPGPVQACPEIPLPFAAIIIILIIIIKDL